MKNKFVGEEEEWRKKGIEDEKNIKRKLLPVS